MKYIVSLALAAVSVGRVTASPIELEVPVCFRFSKKLSSPNLAN